MLPNLDDELWCLNLILVSPLTHLPSLQYFPRTQFASLRQREVTQMEFSL